MPNTDQQKAGCYGAKGGMFNSCFPLDEDSPDKTEDRSCALRIPRLGIRLNPIVTLVSMTVIWGFVAWGMTYPDDMGVRLAALKNQITIKFTWFYISTKDVWLLFVIWLYFSKYSKMKLGKDDDVPEFSITTWFVMLIAAGHGGPIYYFAIAEPIWHYNKAGGGNRFLADAYMPDNTLAQWSMNMTLYHWGFHGWTTYVVGLALAFICYRFDLPITMKSGFYPLLGDNIYGWMGDIIDATSIISILLGLCNVLGYAAILINTGFAILNPNIPESLTVQVIIIWGLTSVATASALTGIRYGIRYLSHVAFAIWIVVLLIVLFLAGAANILNLFVQNVGFYFQWIIQTGFHTDAFEQMAPSAGGSSRGRNFPDGSSDGPDYWMNTWTVFYWGWWVSYAPFIGVFMARISKGRTVGEFIIGVMSAPVLLTAFWITILGGYGLDMERKAAGAGLCCDANFNMSVNATSIATEVSKGMLCDNGQCNPCAENIMVLYASDYQIDNIALIDHFSTENFGISLPNRTLTRLSCHTSEEMLFDVMNSFGSLGTFLSGLSTTGLILYFITSSDSASFMVDCLAANGDRHPPRIQRAFWAITEGATATALIWYGGGQSLGNLQTITVIAGFPFTILICILCLSLWKALIIVSEDINAEQKEFTINICDIFAKPTVRTTGHALLHIVIAPYHIARVLVSTGDQKWRQWKIAVYAIVLFLLLIAFILLHVAVIWVEETWALAWVCYLIFSSAGFAARASLRNRYSISGTFIEDIFWSIFLYPVMSFQISETLNYYMSLDSKLRTHHLDGIQDGNQTDNREPQILVEQNYEPSILSERL